MKVLKALLPEIFGVVFGILALAFGFSVFSLSLKLVNSKFITENIENMNALSIGAIVAVFLFFVKEILEHTRKLKARARKIKALKTILAEEIKINYWVWLQIESLVNIVKNMPSSTEYIINTSTSGTERFIYVRPDGGGGGQAFPAVKDDFLTKLIIEIAELDEKFYSSTIAYSKGLAELKHLRKGAYDFIHETQQGKHYTEGFCEYALGELPEIKNSFKQLFKECAGEEELQHRMR